MSYASLGSSLGKVTTTGKPIVVPPSSPSAWAAANRLGESVGRMMEDSFLDDVIYSRRHFSDAFRRAGGTIERVGRAVGVMHVPQSDAQQMILGSLLQAKRAIAWIRTMSYSPTARARQLEQAQIAATGRLIHNTNLLLQQAKRSAGSGTSGMGVIIGGIIVVLLVVAVVVMLSEDVETVNDLSEAMRACSEAECTPEERAAIIAEWQRHREEADKQDAESGRDPLGLKGTISDILKGAAVVGGVLVGGYLLWVASPLLFGGGKVVRGVFKRKVAKNRRRRTTRRRRA